MVYAFVEYKLMIYPIGYDTKQTLNPFCLLMDIIRANHYHYVKRLNLLLTTMTALGLNGG